MSKRPKLLITQSLLSAWQYLYEANPDTAFDINDEDTYDDDGERKESPYESFLSTLNKEERPMSEAAKKGIEFESLVVAVCKGSANTDHIWHEPARKIAQEVRGGQFQVVATKDIEVAGYEFLLYGRADCLKAGVISDIKLTGTYETGKYFNSPQHPMYMEIIPEAYQFVYRVFAYDPRDGCDVFNETYNRDEYLPIQHAIKEFMGFLESENLMSAYMEKWQAKQ